MAKILSPNKGYTGISASVPFAGGVGATDKPHLIKWFKEHGYTVVQDEAKGNGEGGEGGIENMSAKELKAYADEKKIDLGKAKSKADMVAAIQKAEAASGNTEPEQPQGEPEGGGDNDGSDNTDGDNGEGGEGQTE